MVPNHWSQSSIMKFQNLPNIPILSLACALIMVCNSLAVDAPVQVTHAAKVVYKFSEEKPDFLTIKETTVIRNQKQELTFEVKLNGEIPSRTDEKIRFYIGFDIDNDKATGSVSTTSPEFGQDLGIWFIREPKSSQFKEYTGEVRYKGVNRDLKIGLVRIQGDTVRFKVRSDLFSLFPSLKVFVSASQTFYEKGRETQEIEVSQSGSFLVPTE